MTMLWIVQFFYNFLSKIEYPSAKFLDILIMALKATIYKADLNIANMDDHIYGDYQLTLALHPSETLERLMVRLMAFARFASDELEFTKDLFETDEPALWQKDLTGQLETWIEVGLPSEDKVKKASARCKTVALVVYGTQVEDWWKRNSKIKTLSNVQVWQIAPQSTAELEQLCERTMQLQLNVMDNEWTLLGEKGQATVVWTQLQ